MYRASNLWVCVAAAFAAAACLEGTPTDAPSLSLSWEEFRANPPVTWETVLATTPREPFAPYRFVVDGDIVLPDEQALREYYEAYLAQEYAARVPSASPLTVATSLGADVIWPVGQRDLSYCISDTFGARKAQMVAAMSSATSSWSARVAVRFVYVPTQDANCNSANPNVLFNVSPVTTTQYYAAAFFPNYARSSRQLLVADAAFTTSAGGRDLEGILRHETGHILGFRHEHIWITCTSEGQSDARRVTSYDVNSVMHYPQCRPSNSGGYRQTETDFAGAVSLYGASATWSPSIRTSEFGDAAGWTASQSYWGTLAYPDLNGDGKKDLCGRSGAGVRCALSTGTAFAATSLWSAEYADGAGWAAFPYYWDTIEYPDLNGDGKQDICGRSTWGLYCALSTGTTFGAHSVWTDGYEDAGGWNSSPTHWKTIKYVDLNGDGKQDVCGRANWGLYCALSTGTSFATPTPWSASFGNADGWSAFPYYWETIEYPDLNGDGKHDVCGRSTWGLYCALSTGTDFGAATLWTNQYSDAEGWATTPSYWATIQYPDLNGDGKQDVCGRSERGAFCALSTGAAFSPPYHWSTSFGSSAGWADNASYWATIQYPDLNGDGKQDVCGRSAFGILCGVSNGAAFSEPYYRALAYSDSAGWGAFPYYWDTIEYPDMNGDGKQDICGRAQAGIFCGL